MTRFGLVDIKIKHPNLLPGLRIEPEHIAEYLYDNRFTNVFSLLEGLNSEGNATLLRCSSSGILYVSDVGGSFDKYEVFEKTATTTEQTLTFTQTVKEIEIESIDYEVYIKTSWDGTNFNPDYILVKSGERKLFPLTCKKVAYKQAGVNNAIFRIIGFY